MTEFSKIKIPFVLALLAAMFSVTPLVQKFGTNSYPLFGLSISVDFVYLLFCGLLSSSVYFYGVGLISEGKFFEIMNKIGHMHYAIALVAPPLFILLYPVSLVSEYVVTAMKLPLFAKIIEYGSLSVLGVISSLISSIIVSAFTKRDKKAKVERLELEENQFLSRSKQLFNDGYYDLSVTESWKALEIGLLKMFEVIGHAPNQRTMQNLLDAAVKKNILSKSQMDELVSVRRARNSAVHAERKISKEEAQEAIELTEKVLAALEKVEDSCYFCGKKFPVLSMKVDDNGGITVCKDCDKKNPNWEEMVTAMGMDP